MNRVRESQENIYNAPRGKRRGAGDDSGAAVKPGWEVKTLGEVCQVVGGGTPSKQRADYYNGEIPWATVRDMRSDVIYETEHKITLAALKSSATNIIPSGNVVIATRVGLGKVCLLGRDTAINQDLRGVIPCDPMQLDVRFLYWWFKSISRLIVEEGTGATVQGVKLPFVKSLPIPVPPLAEQERIVAILDEAFAGIATARANAEKNLQNARALFEGHLNAIFTQGSQSAAEGRGEGWVEKRLGDVAVFRNGINFTKTSRGESVRILGVKDFQKNFWAPDEGLDLITADRELPETDLLRENDLLFVRSNGNIELIGRCVLVGAISERTTHSGFTIRARLNDESILPQYLCHFLKSEKARREMIEGGTGTNIKSLNQTILSCLEIPTPTLDIQQQTVEKIEILFEETQRLESIYQHKIAALDELKQSLLHKAFSGKLQPKFQ